MRVEAEQRAALIEAARCGGEIARGCEKYRTDKHPKCAEPRVLIT
jgi:hypothetical protein